MRTAMRKRQRLGDSKIQQPHFVVGSNLDVRRLDVAMHHGPPLPVDHRLKRVQLVELAQDLNRESRRPRRLDASLFFQNLCYGPALDVLHRDEEESVQIPVVVDLDHARIGIVQLPLQIGAAPLGFENQLRQRIGRFLNNF